MTAPHNEIIDLNTEFFPYSSWSDFTRTHWWIAYAGGAPWIKPIGFAGVQIIEDEAFLCRSAVRSEFRGQGLQRTFIRKRTQFCAANGIKNIYTYTTTYNIHSMRNLISNKFRPTLFPAGVWIGTQLDLEEDENYVYWKKEYEL